MRFTPIVLFFLCTGTPLPSTKAFLVSPQQNDVVNFKNEIAAKNMSPKMQSSFQDDIEKYSRATYSISARNARILAPLSAISSSLALTSNKQPALALAKPPTFSQTQRQFFPASLPSSRVATRALQVLAERGYTADNTLLAASLCSDEVNDTPKSLLGVMGKGLVKPNSGGVFNLGGLGGVPFVGPSGFGAFFSHCPTNGKVVIVYGPHVGISADGVVGKIERIGMDGQSGACGAGLGAYKAIKAEKERGALAAVEESPAKERGLPYSDVARDIQEDYIITELRKKIIGEDLTGPDENTLVTMVTNRMFDIVAEMLAREVESAYNKLGFWDKITEITLLGGIVINRGNADGLRNVEDYFQPITFKSLTRGPMNTIATKNLLAELYDETRQEKFAIQIPEPIPVPKPEGSTIGLAAAAAATAAAGTLYVQQQQINSSSPAVAASGTLRGKEARVLTPKPPSYPPLRGSIPSISTQNQEKQPLDKVNDFFFGSDPELIYNKKLTSLTNELLTAALATDRGLDAFLNQRRAVDGIITDLEMRNTIADPANSPEILGTWELLYTDTQSFRSSPFFLCRRASCRSENEAFQFDSFCERQQKALQIGNVGKIRQVISSSQLISELELDFGTLESCIVSSASITPTIDNKGYNLVHETIEIKGSNVPVARQLLDLKIGSKEIGGFLGARTHAILDTTYLDDNIRISRDEEENVFVFGKVSDDTQPTDYSGVTPDMGLNKFLV